MPRNFWILGMIITLGCADPVLSETSTAPVLSPAQSDGAVKELRARSLTFPIDGFDVARIKGSFEEMRGGSPHHASDILAPRGTEIHAVDDGTVAKLFLSELGGITVYQYDSQKKFVYFYAHMEGYAPGLKDGAIVKKGDVLGYVGTSGDAPKNTPHLHFEITIPGPEKKWWQTAPIDPYLVFDK